MAKELPYFKFEFGEWDNGNIQMCNLEEKGLFIDLCSLFWARLGDLPEKLAVQKVCGGNAVALNSLIEAQVISIKDGKIHIEFLSEQLEEFEYLSSTNKKNALSGWENRRKNATALNSQSGRNAIRGEKRREEEKRKEEKGEIFSENFEYVIFEDKSKGKLSVNEKCLASNSEIKANEFKKSDFNNIIFDK